MRTYGTAPRHSYSLLRAGLLLYLLSSAFTNVFAADLPHELFGWDQRSLPANPNNAPNMDSPSTSASGLPHLLSADVITVLHAPDIETTFIELESNSKRFWVASALITYDIGKRVQFSPHTAIKVDNFESFSLLRTFERLYFVAELLPIK